MGMDSHEPKLNQNGDHSERIGLKTNACLNSSKCSYKNPLHGGLFVNNAPCYSSCGKFIFVSSSSKIHIYTSKDLSYKFLIPGNTSIISTFVYCGINDYLLVLSSIGKLTVYRMEEDYSGYCKFNEYIFYEMEMLDMKVLKSGKIFLVAKQKNGAKSVGIYNLQLEFNELHLNPIDSTDKLNCVCKFDGDLTCFAVSFSGDLIAVAVSKLLLLLRLEDITDIYNRKNCKSNSVTMYSMLTMNQITTLAFHPRQNFLASGDITGKVITWHIGYKTENGCTSGPPVLVALSNIISSSLNLVASEKRKSGIYILNDCSEPISPRLIAEEMVNSEHRLASLQHFDGENSQNVVIDCFKFGNYFGLHECDTRIFHWHAHAINSLVFTNCGRLMLTGGEEAVVVVWDLENNTKKFISRLGSTINHIVISTVDNIPMEYLVTCGNNCIRTFDPVLFMQRYTIHGIEVPIGMSVSNFYADKSVVSVTDRVDIVAVDGDYDKMVGVWPKSCSIYFRSLEPNPNNFSQYGCLAVSISGVKLQFFSILTGTLHSFLDFVDSNYVSRCQEEFGSGYLVEKICISKDCTRIVASSFRNVYKSRKSPQNFSFEKRILRFWHLKNDDFTFQVNTQINNPHSSSVLEILENSSANSFITISKYDWKCWSICKEFGKWHCSFNGSFKEFANLSACLSIDKSLMAISHGKHVSFWDTGDQSLILHKGVSSTPVFWMFFVGYHHLLTASDDDISIWDIFDPSTLPIQSQKLDGFGVLQLLYGESYFNGFICIRGDELNSKLEVFRIDTKDYTFKLSYTEERRVPNGYVTCCLTRIPFFTVDAVNSGKVIIDATKGAIGAIGIDQIINSSGHLTLLIVLLNNMEVQSYEIDPESLEINLCEYLEPLVDGLGRAVDKKRLSAPTSALPNGINTGQHVKRGSIVKPFEDDCPTFALPTPSVAFHMMSKSLLKENARH